MQVQQRTQLLPLSFLELKKKLRPTGTCRDLRTEHVVLIRTAGLAVAISSLDPSGGFQQQLQQFPRSVGLACAQGEGATNDQSRGNAFGSPETGAGSVVLSLRCPTASRCLLRGVSSTSPSHTTCFITHVISPPALRRKSSVPGWLSPPGCSTQGVQHHIAFLCYHPRARPAPCKLCTVLRTKNQHLHTMPPFLCLSMTSCSIPYFL